MSCLRDTLGQVSTEMNQAHEAFELGKYDEAIDLYGVAADQFEKSNDVENYVFAQLKIAESLNRIGSITQGLELSQKILNYLESLDLKSKLLIAEAYNVIGDAYLNLGRNDQALESLIKSRDFFIEAGGEESIELASCYNDLGIVYWNNGNKELALRYHQNALKIRKDIHAKDHTEIADSYNNIGLIEMQDDEFGAYIDFSKALTIYKNTVSYTHLTLPTKRIV